VRAARIVLAWRDATNKTYVAALAVPAVLLLFWAISRCGGVDYNMLSLLPGGLAGGAVRWRVTASRKRASFAPEKKVELERTLVLKTVSRWLNAQGDDEEHPARDSGQ
jgi:hypothetical protein